MDGEMRSDFSADAAAEPMAAAAAAEGESARMTASASAAASFIIPVSHMSSASAIASSASAAASELAVFCSKCMRMGEMLSGAHDCEVALAATLLEGVDAEGTIAIAPAPAEGDASK